MDIQAYFGLSQKVTCSFHSRALHFLKPAKTSRNTLVQHDVAYLVLHGPNGLGIGEFAPIRGLSNDSIEMLPVLVEDWNNSDQKWNWPIWQMRSSAFAFALETALLHHNGNFLKPFHPIPINGLVWMNELETMFDEALQKINAGFDCIKLKVGAHRFEDEIELLRRIRNLAPPHQITLRLDANGAFSPSDALDKLNALAAFDIHSIEQPIRAGQIEEMAKICEKSPIPIGLDEELIGIHSLEAKNVLLSSIRPHYVILKPTLHGGLQGADQWIDVASLHGIGWWATSALESNVGLHAIAQWLQHKSYQGHQGLGTGSLYSNNIPAPMGVEKGMLLWDANRQWQFDFLN
jgi:O-succinylbenzoate synthase